MNANKLTTFQFKERITETKHAKNKLEEHLTKVNIFFPESRSSNL